MFSALALAVKYFSSTYNCYNQIIGPDPITGKDTILSSTNFTIQASIQNPDKEGEEIVLGRQDAMAYQEILILSLDRIDLGDPVYDGNIQSRTIINYEGEYFRVMQDAPVQSTYYRYHGQLLRDLTMVGFILNQSALGVGAFG